MASGLQATKRRINSVDSTKKITKALNQISKGDFTVQLDEHYFNSPKINEIIITIFIHCI